MLLFFSSFSSKCSFLSRYLMRKCEMIFYCFGTGESVYYSTLRWVSYYLCPEILLREVLMFNFFCFSMGGRNLFLVYCCGVY